MRLIFVEQLHDQRASCRTIVTNITPIKWFMPLEVK